MEPDRLEEAESLLDHEFQDRKLLERALTHASIADHRLESNERLEFLGDAVLGLVVCEYLYCEYEDFLEGDMTKIKSSVVSRNVCAQVAGEMGFHELLRLGKGMSNRVNLPDSVVAAVYESLIGAVFLDGGLDPARRFILSSLERAFEQCVAGIGHDNHKSDLQQYAQRCLSATHHYVTLDEQGPDHSKCFEVCVVIDGTRFPSAWGPNKKQAEQEAARKAIESIHADRDRASDTPQG